MISGILKKKDRNSFPRSIIEFFNFKHISQYGRGKINVYLLNEKGSNYHFFGVYLFIYI
jgi:hypothetical protein